MVHVLDFETARASANSAAVQLLNHTHFQLINIRGFNVRELGSFREIREIYVPRK
jgi:hypothetical protein